MTGASDPRWLIVGAGSFGTAMARILGAQPVQLTLAARTPEHADAMRRSGTNERYFPGIELPATPAALWLWLRGEDRGELHLRAQRIEALLAPVFRLVDSIDAFKHDSGRDLSGYEDGTENPQGDDATTAAIAADGSSLVAVQRWLHDFRRLAAMASEARDDCIGRRRSDNEELDDAPASAHVKRTAQESFSPEAFLLRRSMPWSEGRDAGLMFVAFGATLDPFELLLGVIHALERNLRPTHGTAFLTSARRYTTAPDRSRGAASVPARIFQRSPSTSTCASSGIV